jgi:arylsulfatase A-like enzyme
MRIIHIPAAGFLLCLLAGKACSVEMNRDSFPIMEDRELAAGKARYLEKLGKLTPEGERPNVLLILADDLGKYDMSTYDRMGTPMPAVDRLAASGVQFWSAYTSSPVCSPSRASMMTGRYQQRFGYERQPMNRYARNRLEYWVVDHFINTDPMQLVSPMSKPARENLVKQGIPASEILLSELLLRQGYHTGIMGKWHLGHFDGFLPNERGFQEQYGFYEAFSYYASPRAEGIVNYRHDYFANRHIWRQKRKGSCAIRENNREIHESEYLTFSIARRACDFMETHREEPFFLFVPFSAPHTPFQVPQEYYDRFPMVEDDNKRVYYGMISALDDAVGMIMKRLDELGLRENTLVIFASDNGGATYTGATDNGILKGGKFSQFEGGVNIPMILSWKGHVPAGQQCTDPVSLLDIYTTCTAMAGIELPGDREYDGVNLLPVLRGESSPVNERALYWRTDFNRAMRRGPWKMVWNERDDQLFLYNLEKDPGEKENLADSRPEKVLEFRRMFDSWEADMKAPMWPGVMEFRFDLDGEVTLWAI